MVRLKGRNYLLKDYNENDNENKEMNEDELFKKVQDLNIKRLKEEKDIKIEKSLNILKEFINNKLEYDPCSIVSLIDLKKKWVEFLKENKYNNLNIDLSLNIKDLLSLNNNFKPKKLLFCKSCNLRKIKNCCDEYTGKNKKVLLHLSNCKLKEV